MVTNMAKMVANMATENKKRQTFLQGGQDGPPLPSWVGRRVLLPPHLKKRGKLANSFFCWTQLDMP